MTDTAAAGDVNDVIVIDSGSAGYTVAFCTARAQPTRRRRCAEAFAYGESALVAALAMSRSRQ